MDSLHASGLGESQQTLLGLLKRSGEATLADLEAGLDLARETLRDHLKALAAQGLVERSGVRREGPGRPHVVYRLSSAAEVLFPRREGALLRELATYLIDTGRFELLEGFFEERLERKLAELAPRLAGADAQERLHRVARMLTDEGFMAQVEETAPGELSLRLCHCPLREIVAVSHLPCRVEMALVEELLGRELVRQSFIPSGDPSCTYRAGHRPRNLDTDQRAES